FHSIKRNSEETIQNPCKYVMEWTSKGLNYFNNYIFIDKSDFHITMKKIVARTLKIKRQL
ncbi:hypothetical protein BJ944DRAFT_159483, partial [Cunninghamella echinulata]